MKVKDLQEALKGKPPEAEIIISVDIIGTGAEERIFSTPQGVQINDPATVTILCWD